MSDNDTHIINIFDILIRIGLIITGNIIINDIIIHIISNGKYKLSIIFCLSILNKIYLNYHCDLANRT